MRKRQEELRFKSWGGRRPDAGRPRGTRISHRPREHFERRSAAHVTLRMRPDVWNLRSSRCHRRILRCLSKARGRFGLRVIHFSVLGNHLHLIVEADDWMALARGLKGLGVRLAHALNRLMGRCGALFDDHYHSELLPSPTRLVNAIAYVLGNARKHYGGQYLDAYSSAALELGRHLAVVCEPLGWLLREGWRRARGLEKLEPFGLIVSG